MNLSATASLTLPWSFRSPMAALAPPTEADDAALVLAVQGGDHDAFGRLVQRHQRRVFRLVGRFFRRPQEVEELAQETFLTAWSKLHTYRAVAPFEHWLTRVCLNTCYATLRKKALVESPLEDGTGRELQAAGPHPDARLEVQGLLAKLPPQDRFVLLLLDGEGWSVAEIAERLGWSRANVKVRAHRARKKLRGLLESAP